MASSVMQIRVDEQLRAEATEIFEQLGIDLPTAVRIFLKRAVLEHGIPFRMTLPPTEDKTTAALRAMNEMQVIAAENELSEMTLDEINAEIAAARNTGGR